MFALSNHKGIYVRKNCITKNILSFQFLFHCLSLVRGLTHKYTARCIHHLIQFNTFSKKKSLHQDISLSSFQSAIYVNFKLHPQLLTNVIRCALLICIQLVNFIWVMLPNTQLLALIIVKSGSNTNIMISAPNSKQPIALKPFHFAMQTVLQEMK